MKIFSDKNKRTAIIGTLLFHVLLVLVLVFTGLTPPMPPRPEIGVEVNLGNSDVGMGEKQPQKPTETVSAPKPKPQEKAPEEIVTQDQEKTVAVPDKKQTVKTEPSNTEPEEVTKKVDERFVFKKKNNTSKGGSEGNDNIAGDKGKKDGNPNAKNYVGSHGNGVSFSLKGRVGRSLPKPKVDYSEEGTVTVKIWVNKSGKVYNAVVQEKGTNTSNTQLRKLAVEAAKASLFDAKPDAPETQVGTIEYVFQIGG